MQTNKTKSGATWFNDFRGVDGERKRLPKLEEHKFRAYCRNSNRSLSSEGSECRHTVMVYTSGAFHYDVQLSPFDCHNATFHAKLQSRCPPVWEHQADTPEHNAEAVFIVRQKKRIALHCGFRCVLDLDGVQELYRPNGHCTPWYGLSYWISQCGSSATWMKLWRARSSSDACTCTGPIGWSPKFELLTSPKLVGCTWCPRKARFHLAASYSELHSLTTSGFDDRKFR